MLISTLSVPLLVPLLLARCNSPAVSAGAAEQDVSLSGIDSCATDVACVDQDEEHNVHLIQTNLVLNVDRPPTRRHGNDASNAPAFSKATALQVLELIQGDDPDTFREVLSEILVDNPLLVNSLATSLQHHLLPKDSKAVENFSTRRNPSGNATEAALHSNTEGNHGRYATEAKKKPSKVDWTKVAPDQGDIRHMLEKLNPILKNAFEKYLRDWAARTGPFDAMQGIWMMLNLDEEECNAWYFVAVVCAYTVACIFVESAWPTTPRMPETGSNRNAEWDLAKFLFVGCVVLMHSNVFVLRLYGEHTLYEMWTGCWVGLPSVMPGLVFISGVFSQSMSKKSLALTFFGLPCTQILFDLALCFETVLTPGFHVFQIGRSGVEWYLECMFVWRLGLAPIFYLARKYGMPLWLIFALTYAASYFPWYFWPYNTHQPFSEIAALKTLIPWRLTVLFGPFFALGLLKTLDEWNALLSNPLTICTSVTIVASFIVLTLSSDGFRTIFDTACASKGQCSVVWWPQSLVEVNNIGMQSLMIYTWVFVQRAIMSLASVSVCFGLLGSMRRRIPRITSLVTSFGTRTLYSYLLHWLLWVLPASRLGLARVLSHQPFIPPPWWRYLCFFVTCWIIHCVLSCRLTEVLFQWLFLLPQWIARCLGIRLDGSRDTEKPVDKTEEASSKETAASLLLAARPA